MAGVLDLESLSIAEVRKAVGSGRVSAAAMAEEHYERIAEKDGAIHSYLALTRERAMQQAERVDAAAKAGEPLGPLKGYPGVLRERPRKQKPRLAEGMF